jgi:glycosyltransferase involved in cell wall biosynthesis
MVASKIVYISDSESIFPTEDIKMLSENYTISPVLLNLIEKDYIKMFKVGMTQIIPNIIKSDLSITWTADYHTLFTVFISRLFNKKSIVHISGMEVSNLPEINYGYQTTFLRRHAVRWILRNATAIIAPSGSYAQKAREFTKKPVYVVPNYADVDPNAPRTKKQPMVIMVATQYMNADDFVLLKGIGTYNKIAAEMPDVEFYLLGKIDETIRKSHPNLHYFGWVPHWIVLDYINLSKVYCQLSYTESFGVSLLEALQSDCIPVVTDKDGMAELVEDNGYKIKYGDWETAVKDIREALKDTDEHTKYSAYYRLKYSRDSRKQNLTNVIHKVIGAK